MSIRQIKKKPHGIADLQDMFGSMMGLSNVDPEIIIPKYIRCIGNVKAVYKVLVSMSQLAARFLVLSDFKEEFEQIGNEALRYKVELKLPETYDEKQLGMMTEDDVNILYKELKTHTIIVEMLELCAALRKYRNCIEEETKLSDRFIKEEPGFNLNVFTFSNLDLKKLWARDVPNSIKDLILFMLHRLYMTLLDIYNVVSSPDVDVDRFSSILVQSLGSLRQIPELKTCKDAFRRIEDSVSLLKTNFSEYYKEAIVSGDLNCIFQSFVLDVANQGKGSNAGLTRQFGIIVNYFQKVSVEKGKSNDPQIKKIMELLSKNYKVMEETTQPPASTDASTNAPTDASTDAHTMSANASTDQPTTGSTSDTSAMADNTDNPTSAGDQPTHQANQDSKTHQNDDLDITSDNKSTVNHSNGRTSTSQTATQATHTAQAATSKPTKKMSIPLASLPDDDIPIYRPTNRSKRVK